MENLKKLLGDAYREGMTLDEINAALDGKSFIDKALFDRKVSELNNESKSWKEKYMQTLSEQEKAQLRMQELEKKNQEYEEREKRLKIESYLAKSGFVDEQIKTLADVFMLGDIDAFGQAMAKIKADIAEAAKTATTKELLRTHTDEPPAGTVSVKPSKLEEYKKMLKIAEEANDKAAQAAYIRLIAEEEKQMSNTLKIQ